MVVLPHDRQFYPSTTPSTGADGVVDGLTDESPAGDTEPVDAPAGRVR
jgi:hypothetical protein